MLSMTSKVMENGCCGDGALRSYEFGFVAQGAQLFSSCRN
jgi:hypothetical protein